MQKNSSLTIKKNQFFSQRWGKSAKVDEKLIRKAVNPVSREDRCSCASQDARLVHSDEDPPDTEARFVDCFRA